MRTLNEQQIKAIKMLLKESDDTVYEWIEWFRPYIASILEITEQEAEEKYYYTFFN